MRGTCICSYLQPLFTRFIPAYAGNISGQKRLLSATSVHPRVCGEHSVGCPSHRSASGSSPRMRGTFLVHFDYAVKARFIPAYAGNIVASWFGSIAATVHPRVCGEHLRPFLTFLRKVGSSPRMRGTSQYAQSNLSNVRFIPAYAGNMSSRECPPRASTVHPRVCGEHVTAAVSSVSIDGSSPRMRGTCRAYPADPDIHRFIPAYAGNIPA